MRVVLLTPYTPLSVHDHAANDVALPLVEALSRLVDLHVYAPAQSNGLLTSWSDKDVTYHAGSSVRQRQIDRFSLYPYAARGTWSRRSTQEALSVVRAVKPDVVHAEYFQTAEPLLRLREPATIMLHDPPDEAGLRPHGDISKVRHLLRQLDSLKIRRTRSAILDRADAVLVYSERDRSKVAEARGIVEIAPGGSSPPPTVGWLGDGAHVAAFGGAMWRPENEATAIFIARRVMPVLRILVPDAELRVFGARPTEAVQALGSEPGVTVVGEVPDFDDEFRRAGVVLAPSMVEAGRLTKAIRAMMMGCPVVMNTASALPMVGLTSGVHALVGDSPEDLAEHIAALMLDGVRARNLGMAGMELVRAYFNWERTVEIYHEVFHRILAIRSAR